MSAFEDWWNAEGCEQFNLAWQNNPAHSWGDNTMAAFAAGMEAAAEIASQEADKWGGLDIAAGIRIVSTNIRKAAEEVKHEITHHATR